MTMMEDVDDYRLSSLEEDEEDYSLVQSQVQNETYFTSLSSTSVPDEGDEGNRIPYHSPALEDAVDRLKWALWVHSYGFAFMFFFLAFYAFFSILNLRSQLSSRPYMTTINSFLCLLGGSRSIVLFIDPYDLEEGRLPPLISTLLWDMGFPALISSFSLIQIAFLQLTQGESGEDGESDTTRKHRTCLSLIISLHFISLIISGILSNLNPDLFLSRPIIQLLFATWGFILCGSFLITGKIILKRGREGTANPPNEKGIANLFGMGMFGGQAQNLASSLTAALAPTLLQGSSSSSSAPSTSTSTSKSDKENAPRIKITDENERTFSPCSEQSRLNDIPEEGAVTATTSISTPPPTTSPRSSFSGEGGPSSPGYVRPPSPVLPRRKSSGPGLKGVACPSSQARRLSWRRDSGSTGSGEQLTAIETKDGVRKKSLTWSSQEQERRPSRGKSMDEGTGTATVGERNGGEALLSTAVGTDYTLQSILSHIAYVNQTALDYRLSRKLSRTNQAHKLLKYASVTAMLGFLVCINELIRLISPLGLLASTSSHPNLWLWFGIHTVHRFLEFLMGATIANITKQPVNRPHPHLAYSIRHKRESLYL